MRKMKVLLVVFLFAGGGYSLYLIADTFLSKKTASMVHIDRFTVPKYITPEEIIASPVIGKTDYQRMQGFKKYMDSLKVNNKRVYDSIMVFRPGLMDSIQFLEKIYLSQNKN